MRTLLDVIKSSRWQKALFTTYTLSLSFFESIILRSLRQGGCQQTWIIADVHGYKSSLIERKSSAVGQDYRLIPVRLSGGVFHPKCTYLVGENEDVLVVGSGNLTFGGFGRNLEVIEVFSSRKDPAIFADFSEFVLALENRGADQFQCADRLWMELFRERAQAAGRGAASVNSPKLVHSVTSPIIETISSMVKDVDDLTVMSPFIDPDAASIYVLAKRIACKRINVAVAPKSTESNFPFELAKGWGLPVQAVWSDGEERKRPLHAKWFEFRTVDGSAVLTGSANATWQALCTTNNVEVSVFRRADGAEPWTQWITSSCQPRSGRSVGRTRISTRNMASPLVRSRSSKRSSALWMALMSKDFFPPRPKSRPMIYAYEDTNPQYANMLKVGYTTVDVQSRVA